MQQFVIHLMVLEPGLKMQGLENHVKINLKVKMKEPYFAQKEHFDFVELHDHLLDVAGTLLVPGGRLVFLFHTEELNQELEK